jgi:GDP-L-fucose synthase
VKPRRIFVAGHRGLVGSAITRQLAVRRDGGEAIDLLLRSRSELDLRDQAATLAFLMTHKPDMVVLAAAKVGGIGANNSYPADFISDNLRIQSNVIDGAFAAGVGRLLFLGSSCIYPRLADQPIREEALLTGPLEPTNEPYAIAKIAGIKLCESYNRQHGTDYRSVMPTNLYGPGDNFNPATSHVLPGLLRRFHEAARKASPSVAIWGTGTPRREFLHVEDMAAACLHVLDLPTETYRAQTAPMLSQINVGTGEDIAIADLAKMIADVTGFTGRIAFDASKPDGTPRKLLDVSRLTKLGWRARIGLRDGIEDTYRWYLANEADLRAA